MSEHHHHYSKFEAMRLAPQFAPAGTTADSYRIAVHTDGLIGAKLIGKAQ